MLDVLLGSNAAPTALFDSVPVPTDGSATPQPSVEPDAPASIGDAPTTTDYTAVDPEVTQQLDESEDPNATVDVVILADPGTRTDPAFLSAAEGLVPLGDGLYAGAITTADAALLEELEGLKVSLDLPAAVEPAEDVTAEGDPQVTPSESDYIWRYDPNAAVSEVDPALAGVRQALGLDGTGEVIAVIDTGIDTNALGLADKVIHREDFSTSSGTCTDGGYLDPVGHGTGVASIVAGAPNSIDPAVEGVAPGAMLVDLRVFNCAASATRSEIDEALLWVLTNHETWNIGAVNLSLSFSSGVQDGTDTTSILVNRLVADGVFVTVVTGNYGDQPSTVRSPGTARYGTTVGAVGVTAYGSYFASYSGQGPVGSRAGVDFLAAGDSIRFANTTRYASLGPIWIGSGTSMAAPYVAGLAALLHQQDASRTPSGTPCVLGPLCPEGVEASSMANPIEDSIQASYWFDPGVDNRSGEGLISASDSLLEAVTDAAPSIEFVLDTDSPMMIEIPPHDVAIGISIVTDASIAENASSVNRLEYALIDATGWPITPDVPCHVSGLATHPSCGITTVEPWNQRVWHFSSAPNNQTTWLRLQSANAVTAIITAPGFGGTLEVRSGVTADDVALDPSGQATVTVRRTATSATATELTIAPSGGLLSPESVILPAGEPGTTVDFTVSKDPGVSPVSPDNGGRLALFDGTSLAFAVSVTYPAESGLLGQLTVGGVPVSLMTSNDRLPVVTSNRTVFGTSLDPALASSTAPGVFVATPYVVDPDSNEAVKVVIPQTSVSSMTAFDASGDGMRLLLQEASSGAGAVPGDTDSRDVYFVHDRGTSLNTEIGSSSTPPGPDWTGRPVISEDGLSAAFLAPLPGEQKGLYWQGGSDFSTTKLVATFAAGDTVYVRGVLATSIIAEYRPAASTSRFSGRIYAAVEEGPFTQFSGDVWILSTFLSADGSAIAYETAFPINIWCY
ncbi:MAG: S8 family serine peptidase, partial [Demequinaceae bacterium]|nr:S8 family serine peptidase [Demequinaceae bacterium]